MTAALLHRVEIDAPRPLPPAAIHGSERFHCALAAGRLETTGCLQCGRLAFPPVAVCPVCRGRRFAWSPLAPHGTLFSHTRVHAAPGQFLPIAPYHLALVDLDDGVRLLCLLLPQPGAQPAIGERVHLVVAQWHDGPMLAAMRSDDHRSRVLLAARGAARP